MASDAVIRSVRSGKVWDDAAGKAKGDGVTMTDVVNLALEAYVAGRFTVRHTKELEWAEPR